MTPPVVLGRGLSAWWLRVLVVLSGAVVVAVGAGEGVLAGLPVVVGLGVLASAYAPASPAPALVVLGGAVALALGGDDPLRPAVLVTVPAVHLFHVACGLAGVLPVRGRLHPAALRRPALRFLAVQGVVFAIAGLAALLPTGRTSPLVEVSALVGLLVLAGVVFGVARPRSHRGR